MDAMELVLLYDYYGDLLTDRQKECFELRYHQDMSLGEIGEELGITRQGVHDNLSRAEQLLRTMEEKTGCVRRDLAGRRAVAEILSAAEALESCKDETVIALARKIASAARALEE
ncbi:MAG: sigma factor-like helix-turn-helix DNA-binding protein [Eubacteriales bacterium]|nr:sigma factor-like helix-turn-helix DNA-binding protein [Eubacteriales bacterium]